jgi:hypothetical protein
MASLQWLSAGYSLSLGVFCGPTVGGAHLVAALRDTSQKFGNPEIGDKKSAHQARFPSSPIDRSPNSVFSDYRQIRIIRTHQNSSESPNSVIRVTRITKYSVIRLFGSPKYSNIRLFGYSVIRVTRITEYSVIRLFGSPEYSNIRLFGYSGHPNKTKFGNKSGSQIRHVFDATMTIASLDQLM